MKTDRPLKRRRWIRRLAGLVLLAGVVLFLSPLLLRLSFVRGRVARRIGDAIGRPVHIANASAFWWSGITLEGITVDSPRGFEEPLATVRRLHVDLDLPALVGGRVHADVAVDSPWITFQEDAEGRSNADGLFPEEEDTRARRKAGDAGGRAEVSVAVHDGLLRARTTGGAPPQEIRDLDASVTVTAERGTEATLAAVAVGAGTAGGDAHVEAALRIPAGEEEEGPIRLHVPEIDLGRLAALARGALGVTGLEGRFRADVDARFSGRGRLSGNVHVGLDGLAARIPDVGPASVGSLAIEGDLSGDEGLLRVEARDLALGAGPVSPRGYREEKVSAGATVRREPSGVVSATLDRLDSRLVRVGTRPNEPPLRFRSGGGDAGFAGTLFLQIDGPALAEAFGGALGLEEARPPAGVLTVDAKVRTRDEAVALDLTMRGPDLGLGGTLHAETAGGDLRQARLVLDGDLARARSLLAPALSLAPGQSIAGRVHAEADVGPEAEGRRLDATLTAQDLAWTDAAGRLLVREPSIRVKKRVLATRSEDGRTTRYRIEAFRLDAAGVALEMTGTATGHERGVTAFEVTTDYDLDAQATLSGDASRLAPSIARFLGPEYADLVGTGAIEGTLLVRGPLSGRGARLLVEGHVAPGSWSAGGLSLDRPQLNVRRDDAAKPIAVEASGRVNDGDLSLTFDVRPGPQRLPWTLDLRAKGIDTSSVLLDHGTGRYLAHLFPTLLPADAKTRALSGRLDATVHLEAADIGGEPMAASLTGQGEVSMDDGTIGQSTLFRVTGSGGGLGRAGDLLAKAIPEIGRELDNLSRALTFTRVESRFRIARKIVWIEHGLLDGEKTRLAFKGTADFEERVNLQVLLMIKGKAAERLNKLLSSPALPLTVKGRLDDPRVTPGVDIEKVAKGALERLLPGGGDNPLDKLRDLIK